MKNRMGPYQRTPKKVARAIRYSGLGVRSVGPVGYFLETSKKCSQRIKNQLEMKNDAWKGCMCLCINIYIYMYIYQDM